MTPIAQWSRRKRVLLGGAGLVVALLAVYAGRGFWRQWRASQELSRIRAAGEPVTAEDLEKLSSVPAGTADATPSWRRPIGALAGGVIGKFPHEVPLIDERGKLPPLEEAIVDDNRAAAHGFLKKHAALYADIDAAAATPGECSYLDDYSGGYYTLIDHVQQLRMIERLLVLRAYVEASQGDAAGAAKSLQNIFRASESLRREPYLVSHLVRMVCNEAAVEAIEHLLSTAAWNDDQLAQLQQSLLSVEYRTGLRLGLYGDRVSGLIAFENPSTAGAGNTPGVVYKIVVRDDPLALLEMTRELLDAVRDDWPAPLERTVQYKDASQERTSATPPWGSGQWEKPSSIGGAARKVIERAACETARLRAAAVGIAALRFYKSQGRWPQSLDELAPRWIDALPVDPCTGKPLLIKVDGKSFVVYSVGIDGQDGGGVETPEMDRGVKFRKGKPDVVFRMRTSRKNPDSAPPSSPN